MDEVEQNIVICLWRGDLYDLRDTDKSRYFAITEFNNNVLTFDHRVCFFNEYPWEVKTVICHFYARAITRRRKAGFPL